MDGDLKPPTDEKIDVVMEDGHEVSLTAKYFIDDKVINDSGKCMNTEQNDKSHKEEAYRIRFANYTPLIGGQMAFGAVQSAIEGATKTVDYICWGFQPSMYFKRKGGVGADMHGKLDESEMIGSVLERAAARGVKVRLLSWFNATGQLSEANLPGNLTMQGKFIGQPIPYSTKQQQQFDYTWHRRLYNNEMPNIELRTRDFHHSERSAIANYLDTQSSDKDNVPKLQHFLLHHFPSHHQKMVIVDYEAPESAIGFVMGHNSTSKYWSAHPYSVVRMRPDIGSDGPTPYHDNSSMITGPLLYDMNHNFSQAWDKESRHTPGLMAARAAIKPEDIPVKSQAKYILDGGAGTSYYVPAQICRTQPQYEVRNIEVAYLQAVMNIGRFAYFDNQYFRFIPLIETMKKNLIKSKEWGGDKNLYVFVTTNTTAKVAESQGGSSSNTYRMLDAIGRSDDMPEREREKEKESLDAQLKDDEKNNPDRVEEDKAKLKELESKIIERKDFGPIKAVVCTLVCTDHGTATSEFNQPPTLKAQKEGEPYVPIWMPIYIHSKTTIIDDALIIHGSANLNLRSMEVDSEMDILVQDYGAAQAMRRDLWNIHAGARGAVDDVYVAFNEWESLIQQNHDQEATVGPPVASIIRFYDTQKNWGTQD